MAAKTQRWNSCNVLATQGEGHLLWGFSRKGDGAALESEKRFGPEEILPADRVGKTFRHTWQPRLNIAWLPSEQAYVRVVELPPSEPAEVPALIEFQIEKLSPLPAAQSVWSFELLPGAEGAPLSAIVLIADREAVEAYLGVLEKAGYRPDRLDLPALRELRALPAPENGLVVLAGAESGRVTTLAGWWTNGRLRHLSLGRFADDAAMVDRLVETLRRTAWAGEVEGWLTEVPPVTLMADATLGARLHASLLDFAGGEIQLRERLSTPELAAVCAAAPTPANLVPPEIRARYRQEFVDRLWMRALGAVALTYVLWVLGNLAWLSLLDYKRAGVDHEVAVLTDSHTKAQQLKARLEILQEQVNLKYAALDCWKAAAEALPESMTLNSLTFQRGKKFGLIGTVPADQQGKVATYNEALAKAVVHGRQLFSAVTTKSIQGPAQGRPGTDATWNLECEINRRDLP